MVSPASPKSNQRPPGESAAANAEEALPATVLAALVDLALVALLVFATRAWEVDLEDETFELDFGEVAEAAGSTSERILALPGVGDEVQAQFESNLAHAAPVLDLG
jgi:hypothetical protein